MIHDIANDLINFCLYHGWVFAIVAVVLMLAIAAYTELNAVSWLGEFDDDEVVYVPEEWDE